MLVYIVYITKRTSPLQTPCIPQSLRDLLRFARQMQSASADIFLLHKYKSRNRFCPLRLNYRIFKTTYMLTFKNRLNHAFLVKPSPY